MGNEHLGCFCLLALSAHSAGGAIMNVRLQVFVQYSFQLFVYLRMAFPDHMVILCLLF